MFMYVIFDLCGVLFMLVYLYTDIHPSTHTHTHIYIYIYIYMISLLSYLYLYMCICICICINMYMHIHTDVLCSIGGVSLPRQRRASRVQGVQGLILNAKPESIQCLGVQ